MSNLLHMNISWPLDIHVFYVFPKCVHTHRGDIFISFQILGSYLNSIVMLYCLVKNYLNQKDIARWSGTFRDGLSKQHQPEVGVKRATKLFAGYNLLLVGIKNCFIVILRWARNHFSVYLYFLKEKREDSGLKMWF